MLKKVNPGRVEGDKGFYIDLISNEYLKYNDGEKTIEFSWLYDHKNRKVYIYVSDNEMVSMADKPKITRKIKEAITLLSTNYEVI